MTNFTPLDHSWLENNYRQPLKNLGGTEKELTGIYSPVYSDAEINRYIGEYYGSREGVLGQYNKMGVDLMNVFYKNCFERAFNYIKWSDLIDKPINVLEIGCGFGFATLPLLELLPNSHFVATDLSLPILSLLRQIVIDRKPDALSRMNFMQLNAEQIYDFNNDTFKIIAGTAVLHHLINPEKTISACQSVLSPGGVAVFFEPFENGYAILGLIYQEIVNFKEAHKLPRQTIAYFKNALITWRNMAKILDKTNIFFIGVDDKWLFTRSFFSRFVENGLFKSLTILPLLNGKEEIFSKVLKVQTTGNNIQSLPNWVWEISHKYDDSFSAELVSDLMTEGIVILHK